MSITAIVIVVAAVALGAYYHTALALKWAEIKAWLQSKSGQ